MTDAINSMARKVFIIWLVAAGLYICIFEGVRLQPRVQYP
jgi:hypothetical protein